MRRVVGYLGVMLIVFVVGLGLMAYFVSSFDPANHVTYEVSVARCRPHLWFMRFFLGTDAEWGGWPWFLIDMLFFWGGVLIGGILAQFGFRTRRP